MKKYTKIFKGAFLLSIFACFFLVTGFLSLSTATEKKSMLDIGGDVVKGQIETEKNRLFEKGKETKGDITAGPKEQVDNTKKQMINVKESTEKKIDDTKEGIKEKTIDVKEGTEKKIDNTKEGVKEKMDDTKEGAEDEISKETTMETPTGDAEELMKKGKDLMNQGKTIMETAKLLNDNSMLEKGQALFNQGEKMFNQGQMLMNMGKQ